MLPFGYRVARRCLEDAPQPIRWIRNLHVSLVGNADLHGLLRCPGLLRRWDFQARWIGDVGCAAGDFHLEALMHRRFQGNVVGIDSDFLALRRARERADACGVGPQVRYVCALAEKIPIRDAVFDQLFLVDLIEHVSADHQVLWESRRVLRPGGRLEVSTPTPHYPRVFGRRTHEGVGHVRSGYWPQELILLLKRSGLQVTHHRQNTGFLVWPWMALWYRVGWALWSPGPKRPIAKILCHLALLFCGVLIRVSSPFDRFGGFCSNDLQAQKTR